MKAQPKETHRTKVPYSPIKSPQYELDAVIAFAKQLGDEFGIAPVDKLVRVVQSKFSNEALLRTITSLYRARFSKDDIANKIPPSMATDSAYLTKIAEMAERLIAARNIIGRMKQLGVIDATTMQQGFDLVRGLWSKTVSQSHAQMYALIFILTEKGFVVDAIRKQEVKKAVKYLGSAQKSEFDIQVFAGFFGSARFVGVDSANESVIIQTDRYVIASRWFDNEEDQQVYWEILPPGEHLFPKLMEHYERLAEKHDSRDDPERLKKVRELKPTASYRGLNTFRDYRVFVFENLNKAVLECPTNGNALYIIEGDWEILSRLTKKELLKDNHRIIHSGDWFLRLQDLLGVTEKAR